MFTTMQKVAMALGLSANESRTVINAHLNGLDLNLANDSIFKREVASLKAMYDSRCELIDAERRNMNKKVLDDNYKISSFTHVPYNIEATINGKTRYLDYYDFEEATLAQADAKKVEAQKKLQTEIEELERKQEICRRICDALGYEYEVYA